MTSSTASALGLGLLAIISACGSELEVEPPEPMTADGGMTRPDANPEPEAGTPDARVDGSEPMPAPSYEPSFRSGTRLEARVWTSDGGDVGMFDTFFDTELGVPCRFQHATDGTIRCLPQSRFDAVGELFLDAACTEPVYFQTRSECGLVEFFSRTAGPPGCDLGNVQEVLRLTPTERPGQIYRRQFDESCQGPNVFTEGAPFDGEVVAPTEFVRGEIRDFANEGQAGVRILESDDGARRVLGAYDPRHELGCDRRGFDGSGLRCMTQPMTRIDQFWFRDDQCDTPLAWTHARASQCAPPAFGLRWTRGSATPELVRVGERYAGTGYTSTECRGVAADEIDLWTLWEPSRDASPSELLAVQDVPTGGPVAANYLAAEDGTPLYPWSFFDRERSAACEPRMFSDGQVRCVGIDAIRNSQNLFADPTCTQPVGLQSAHRVAEGAPSMATLEDVDLCAPLGNFGVIEDAYEVGAEHRGDVYLFSGGTCEPTEPAPDSRMFLVGPSIRSALQRLTTIPAGR
ncbi:MAG: hypothetical protein AAGF12_31505 [Myxococcota bacterium]